MPNSVSANKRLRQNVAHRNRNRAIKSEMATYIRQLREAVAAGETEKAETLLPKVAQKLDRAGARGIIHRNRAARVKSRLSKLIRVAKTAS